ncbi:MAG TPA: ATP-binding protein [Terriglobia bacterium]|nr:ATP-binding protein [Terriglobia bacterium]
MEHFLRQRVLGYLSPLAGVGAVTLSYKLLITGVNATTLALSFLLVVLLTAAYSGLGPAILAALASMLCFNFFFLEPIGTFTIHDPQNWVALFAFLVTAIIASQLSSAARKRTREAEESHEQVWKLYQVSRAIITTPDPETAVAIISEQVREIFNIGNCEVYVPDEGGKLGRTEAAAQVNASNLLLQEVFESGAIRGDAGEGAIYAPLKVGVRVTGVMVLTSCELKRATIEAIGVLVALALERARFLKELSRTEALRQSDQLKSALLASVSHDLRTPLTSIRAAVDNLLDKSLDWDRDALREFHLIISEEVGRLTRLVQNLLEMARIEAGELHPAREWASVNEMIDTVLERCAATLANHQVIVELKEGLPLVKVDARLLASALANLVENAAQYSSAQSHIVVCAEVDTNTNTLTMRIQDEGPGIPVHDLPRLFDKFYRGSKHSASRHQGTGMGLAISRGIVEAHGGKIWVESSSGIGSTFFFSVPVELRTASSLAPVGDEG